MASLITKPGSAGRWPILFCAGVLPLLFLACDEETPLEPVCVADKYEVSLARHLWYTASPPETFSAGNRGEYVWYNIEIEYRASRRDFYPNLDPSQDTPVLTLDIEPDLPLPESSDVWMGIMRGFWAPLGLDASKRAYLDIWVNDFKPDTLDRGGFLHIDIGRIDEDFYEPDLNRWNDEDRNSDGFSVCQEDAGLDGRFNKLPFCVNPDDPLLPDPPDEGGVNEDDDRAGDDYDPHRIDGRFSRINGTEGNQRYDTEDLDRSGALDQWDSYYSYVIDLANDVPIRDIRVEFPTYDGFDDPYHEKDSWRKYRILLSGGVPVGGDCCPPRLENVRHIRIWFDDVATVINHDYWRRIQISGIKFAN